MNIHPNLIVELTTSTSPKNLTVHALTRTITTQKTVTHAAVGTLSVQKCSTVAAPFSISTIIKYSGLERLPTCNSFAILINDPNHDAQPTANPTDGHTNILDHCTNALGIGYRTAISPIAWFTDHAIEPARKYPINIAAGPPLRSDVPLPSHTPSPMDEPSAIMVMWRVDSMRRRLVSAPWLLVFWAGLAGGFSEFSLLDGDGVDTTMVSVERTFRIQIAASLGLQDIILFLC